MVLDGLGQGLNRYRDEIIQSRPLTIKVAAGYAAMAAAWFAVSDSIEALFSSPMSILEIDGALDAGFIAITTVCSSPHYAAFRAPLLYWRRPRNGCSASFGIL